MGKMTVRLAFIVANVVIAVSDYDDSILLDLPPDLISVEGHPEVKSGWIYDPVTGTFSPNWVLEKSNALDSLLGSFGAHRSPVTISSVVYDSSDNGFARLITRIRAREELADTTLQTRLMRMVDGSSVPTTLAQDKALLAAMFEHVDACEGVYVAAVAAVLAACVAQDLVALDLAINPTWPT